MNPITAVLIGLLSFPLFGADKQLAIDNAVLTRDKLALTQAVSKLTVQVAALNSANDALRTQTGELDATRKQVKQLQRQLNERPATVILPSSAQRTLEKASATVESNKELASANNQVSNETASLLQQVDGRMEKGFARQIRVLMVGSMCLMLLFAACFGIELWWVAKTFQRREQQEQV